MKKGLEASKISNVTLAGLIVTLGIVYGDIGTSPLYVLSAITSGQKIDQNFILGALSCIFWTLTLQTTIKYVIITLRADNKGEGGIFSLFALLRRRFPWAYVFAIIGGCALLADGIITPSISVMSAIEGFNIIYPHISVIPIALVIILCLFVAQQFGTKFIGTSFGPIMVVWFSMLGLFGLISVVHYPAIFKAINPYYAYLLLSHHPGGFVLLGAVFLATTGAEALYSDLGHCGVANIRISWIFVKTTLILNYFGQGAWLLFHQIPKDATPFYALMPRWFLVPGIVISTLATIVASQALLSGSFTLISEAMSLNFWPRMKKSYPTQIKGQIYLPAVNWFLFFGCVFVILYFQESSAMQSAYGLSITITMIMTSILLIFYLMMKKVSTYFVGLFMFVYSIIEGSFLIANLHKFADGGWFTLLMAFLFFLVMYSWYHARKIRNSFMIFVKIADYVDVIKALSHDKSVAKYATNLAFITRANISGDIESKIIYSILNKHPKRADVYWFLHVDILDEPYTFEYELTEITPRVMYKIDFRLGFKVEPRINMYFKQVLDEMEQNNEIDLISRYDSLRRYHVDSDFLFVIIDRITTFDYEFSPHDKFMMALYKILRRLGVGEVKAFGLDTSNVLIEKVPLMVDKSYKRVIQRKKKNILKF